MREWAREGGKMAFKDHKVNNNCEIMAIQNAIARYGLPLFMFYALVLCPAEAVISAVRSSYKKYNLL